MIQKWGEFEAGICTCPFLADSGSIKIQEGQQKGGMHYEMGKISFWRSKLDEAIEDMETGRVQTIEEVWRELDAL